jgi:4'-phosphopantetheinyl transferase
MLKDGETVAWIDYQDKKYRYNTHFLEFEGFSCAFVIT